MGLHVEVFRWQLGDCSLGGVSSRFNTLTLVDCPGPFEPCDKYPAVRLNRKGGVVCAEPVDGVGPWMHGGTFIYSCDSRFRQFVGNGGYPVALHDRSLVRESVRDHSVRCGR